MQIGDKVYLAGGDRITTGEIIVMNQRHRYGVQWPDGRIWYYWSCELVKREG